MDTFDISELHRLLDSTSLYLIAAFVTLGFMGIYFSYAGLSLWLTRRVLPKLGIGALIESRALAKGQLGSEIVHSVASIIIFALYGVLTVWLERVAVVAIDWQPTLPVVVGNLCLLVVWNEIHFYVCHRTLHTPWLYRKVHAIHHRSIVPTPFSTFSFHWFEATLLSSVMILLLLVWPLDIISIIVFPGISLIANSIGHMNYAVFPNKSHDDFFAACQRHTAHHTRWTGNYGFYLPWIDRFLNTRVKDSRDE